MSEGSTPRISLFWKWLPWSLLLGFLAIGLPLFLCTPLVSDSNLYDLIAREMLRGQVHYRDTVDNNFPGLIWVHIAIRTVFGWSPVVLRVADLLILSAIIGLFLLWVPRGPYAVAVRGWATLAVFAFHFSTPEICHCQRDYWMLLPLLLALRIRQYQIHRVADSTSRWSLTGWSFLEGLLWACGVWIKPFVLLVGLGVWLLSFLLFLRAEKKWAGGFLTSTLALLAGGLVGAGGGLLWLWQSGSWPYFWDMMTEWNPTYLTVAPLHQRFTAFLSWSLRYPPWVLVHLVAIPCSLLAISDGFASRSPDSRARGSALIAGFYLVWLVQALWFQLPHDYVLSSTVLPAIGVIAGARSLKNPGVEAALGLSVFLVFVLLLHPLLKWDRLRLWGLCLQEGRSARIKDALTGVGGIHGTSWQDLEKVAGFLRNAGAKDGEVTCFSHSSRPLYLQLDIRPSTRFTAYERPLTLYPHKRDELLHALSASQQRFVITDTVGMKMAFQRFAREKPNLSRKELQQIFPWNQPVVFQAGRYQVRRVTEPVKAIWP